MRPVAQNDNALKAPALRQGVDPATLSGLRAQVQAIEARGHKLVMAEAAPAPSAGQAPEHRPEAGWMHEIWAERPADTAPAMALLLSWLAADERPILWVLAPSVAREQGLPYGPGLMGHGIDPARLVLVRTRTEQDALWALEEGLKSTALAAVVGEVAGMELTESRRLALTAKEQGTACFLLVRSPDAQSSATYSRWQVTAAPSGPAAYFERAPGPARLMAGLVKHRGGRRPENYELEWQDATHHFHLAAPLGGRSLATDAPPVRRAI